MNSMKPYSAFDIEEELQQALQGSKESSERGFKLENDALALLKNVVKEVSSDIKENVSNLNKGKLRDNDLSKNLSKQLTSIRADFESLPRQIQKDLEGISEKSFSITLFGRTMAGKSTLMEVITHGNGKSIGNGSQLNKSRGWRGERKEDTHDCKDHSAPPHFAVAIIVQGFLCETRENLALFQTINAIL